jgi:hypothetical protein
VGRTLESLRAARPSWVLVVLCAVTVPAFSAAQDASDPFGVLRRHASSSAAAVPPRAIAVIPERHTGRLLRVVDVLVAIDPQFDAAATEAGFSISNAIQVRTREARVPIYVPKTDATIATLLQLPIGSRVEVRGVLVSRGTSFLFVASEIRPAPRASEPAPRSGGPAKPSDGLVESHSTERGGAAGSEKTAR